MDFSCCLCHCLNNILIQTFFLSYAVQDLLLFFKLFFIVSLFFSLKKKKKDQAYNFVVISFENEI